MPQTARQLITKSFYLSGIVSRGFQTVEGDKLFDGLDLLNSILSFKTVDNRKIPYFTEYNFDTIIGQEKYFIPGLVSCETFTWLLNSSSSQEFMITEDAEDEMITEHDELMITELSSDINPNGIRMPMRSLERIAYFSIPRIENINSLPSYYHIERCMGGANAFIYPLPNAIYPFTMYGKFSLQEVNENDDLELTFDKFFIEYLRYLLASYICEFYEIDVPNSVLRRLSTYESQMKDISPIDFSMNKTSSLGSSLNIDPYILANLSNGWWP
jgi:hypothetical protein